jgi:hypothetical protein
MRYRLRVCKNSMQRIMSGPKREKVNRGRHNYIMNNIIGPPGHYKHHEMDGEN